jgi:hypothetical protein
LGAISESLISPNQTAFIKDKYILESVVSAHEIIHAIAHSGQSGFVFMLDYEKVYDMVNREFLITMMTNRGFSLRWIYILKSLLDNGSVGVRINNENSDFFLIGTGVRQGDPISPILFNFVADVMRAAGHSQIRGLLQSLNGTGVISLQYADDTLLFLENNLAVARNLKWLLSCFEQLSGMRINFHKCDLIALNVDEQEAQVFSQTLSCKLGKLPMKYLGVPLHYTKLRKEDLQPIID